MTYFPIKISRQRILGTLILVVLGMAVYLIHPWGSIPGKSEQTCKDTDNKYQCYDRVMGDTLSSKGLDEAFKQLAMFYSSDQEFAANCHDYTHKLGGYAYDHFFADGKIELSDKTSYCGYGFYHGFIEELLSTGGNIEEARKFCSYSGKVQADVNAEAEAACYHGIGHGIVDGSDPRAWGNAQAMINPALGICKKIADNYEFLMRCGSGVFNSLALISDIPKYKLQLSKNEPYTICGQQIGEYFKQACYQEMNTLVINSSNDDLSYALSFVEKITDYKYAEIAMDSLAAMAVNRNLDNLSNDQVINICHSLQARLQNFCISGFVSGIIEFGHPGEEHTAAKDFCDNETLTEAERHFCFQRMLWLTKTHYTSEKHQSVCMLIEEKYRYYCRIN